LKATLRLDVDGWTASINARSLRYIRRDGALHDGETL
jgi:hypothetical protein